MSGQDLLPGEWFELKKTNTTRLREAVEELEREFDFSFVGSIFRNPIDLHPLIPRSDIDFEELFSSMAEVSALFKSLKPTFKEEREELWERFSKFRTNAHNERNQVFDRNRSEIEHEIHALRGNHELTFVDNWVGNINLRGFWDDARAITQLFKDTRLRKDDRTELWGMFQRVCDAARDAQNEIAKQKERKKEEWERKNAEWRERMSDKIDRLRGVVRSKEEFIERLDELISQDEERRDNARSSDFADKVQGWIDEKEAKKQEVYEQIREIEEKISEIERKLGY